MRNNWMWAAIEVSPEEEVAWEEEVASPFERVCLTRDLEEGEWFDVDNCEAAVFTAGHLEERWL